MDKIYRDKVKEGNRVRVKRNEKDQDYMKKQNLN